MVYIDINRSEIETDVLHLATTGHYDVLVVGQMLVERSINGFDVSLLNTILGAGYIIHDPEAA